MENSSTSGSVVGLGLPQAQLSWRRWKLRLCYQQGARPPLPKMFYQMQGRGISAPARMSWAESLGHPHEWGSEAAPGTQTQMGGY